MNGKLINRCAGVAILLMLMLPAILPGVSASPLPQAASMKMNPAQAKDTADDVEVVAVDVSAADTAGCTAARAFLLMPRQDLDILPISVREDMLDYLDADSLIAMPNVYMGFSKIEEATPDYMRVKLSDASSIQFKILESSKLKKPIVMTIYTVGADSNTTDSTIKFFSFDSGASLTELDASKFFTLPDPKLFFDIPRGNSLTAKDIEEIMPFYTVEYTAAPATTQLRGKLTMSDYLTQEQLQQIQPLLHPNLSWSWDGKKYKLEK